MVSRSSTRSCLNRGNVNCTVPFFNCFDTFCRDKFLPFRFSRRTTFLMAPSSTSAPVNSMVTVVFDDRSLVRIFHSQSTLAVGVAVAVAVAEGVGDDSKVAVGVLVGVGVSASLKVRVGVTVGV